jgi:hypothetical protein
MADGNRAQENRYELKYVVDEPTARAVRDYARSFLAPDPNATAKNACGYAVHSVYLDSADFALCRATLEGHKNRYKLRVRFYDQDADSPVFCEIKRRIGDATIKLRAAVLRKSLPGLLAGHWPEASDLYNAADPRAMGALREFCELRSGLLANGQVIVSYLREAYVSANGGDARLTFDRDISATMWRGQLTGQALVDGIRPGIGGVVLELKFTDRFPDWMRTMVRIFNLQRRSVAKYVECALALGPKVPLPWKRQVEAAI